MLQLILDVDLDALVGIVLRLIAEDLAHVGTDGLDVGLSGGETALAALLLPLGVPLGDGGADDVETRFGDVLGRLAEDGVGGHLREEREGVVVERDEGGTRVGVGKRARNAGGREGLEARGEKPSGGSHGGDGGE